MGAMKGGAGERDMEWVRPKHNVLAYEITKQKDLR